MPRIIDDYNSPRTGIFTLTEKITRQLPTSTNEVTHEYIHSSVLKQAHLLPQLQANLQQDPALVAGLYPIENRLKEYWQYVPGKYPPQDVKTEEAQQNQPDDGLHKSMIKMALAKGSSMGQQALHDLTHSEVMQNASGHPVAQKNALGKYLDESPFGAHIKSWM